MDPRPIGLFDSGVGGLSVVRELQARAPHERLIYFADTAWFPYGGRPGAELRKRSFAISRRLLDLDCKLIVVACNTASAAALADLREAFPVPFVGMVPGVKPAVASSPNRHVAVLATGGTLRGDLYADVAVRFGRDTRITEVAAPRLAGVVESGQAGTPLARDELREALGPAVANGADTVVLGCTHYHFLVDDIEAEFPGIHVVDTAAPVAQRVVDVLREDGLDAPPGQSGTLDLVVSGDRAALRETMQNLGFAPVEFASEVRS